MKKALLILTQMTLCWAVWSCQAPETTEPTTEHVHAEAQLDASQPQEQKGEQDQADTTKRDQPDTRTPEPAPVKSRTVVLAETDALNSVSSLRLSILQTKTGQKKELASAAFFKDSIGVFIAHYRSEHRVGKWPEGKKIKYTWEAPIGEILVARQSATSASVQIDIFDLSGKNIYQASLPQGLFQVRLSPDGKDVWYQKSDGTHHRWRRDGKAPPLPVKGINQIYYEKKGGNFLFVSGGKGKGGDTLTLLQADGTTKNITIKTGAGNALPNSCYPTYLTQHGLICLEQWGAGSTFIRRLWFVSFSGTQQALTTPIDPKHQSEQFMGELSNGQILYRQSANGYKLTTFDPASKASQNLYSVRYRRSNSHQASFGGEHVYLRRILQDPTERTLLLLSEGKKEQLLTNDFGKMETGYTPNIQHTAANGSWAFLVTTWSMSSNPKEPGLAYLFSQNGKRIYQRKLWTATQFHSSPDGGFVTFVEGMEFGETKAVLRWLHITGDTTKEGMLELPRKPALLSVGP